MRTREQDPLFHFSNSFEQTLKDDEQTSEASQADYQRAQAGRDIHENKRSTEMK